MSDAAAEEPTPGPSRNEKWQWLPGGPSPNPQGGAIATYPRDWRELRSLAQQYVPEAIEKIVEIWRTSRSRKTQLAAIGMLLDRAHGKAHEMVEVLNTPPQQRYTGWELARRVAFLLDPPLERRPPPQLPVPETRRPQLLDTEAHITANAPTDDESSSG